MKNCTSKAVYSVIVLLLSFLILILIDRFVFWEFSKLELNYLKVNNYKSTSFKGGKESNKIFDGLSSVQSGFKNSVFASSSFSISCPLILTVLCSNDAVLTLPWLGEYLFEKGKTTVSIQKRNRVFVEHGDRIKTLHRLVLGGFVLNRSKKYSNSKMNFFNYKNHQYIYESKYLRKIFSFYFVFPLVIIAFGFTFIGSQVRLSFLYFFEMLFFSDSFLFLSGPYSLLYEMHGIISMKFISFASIVLLIGVYAFFVYEIFMFFKNFEVSKFLTIKTGIFNVSILSLPFLFLI